MIVPMKRVSLIVLAYEKRRALKELRKAGIVHVDDVEVKNETMEELQQASQKMQRATLRLQELRKERLKKAKERDAEATGRFADEEDFSETHARVLWLMDEQQELSERIQKAKVERERLLEWGDFSVEDLRMLADRGLLLHVYRMTRKVFQTLPRDIDFIRLSDSGKSITIVTVADELPEGTVAKKLDVPQRSISQLEAAIESDHQRIEGIEDELFELSSYLESYREHLRLLEQNIRFERVSASMGEDDTVAWLSGYIPAPEVEKLKQLAARNSWAYALDDPKAEELPPTQVKNPRWAGIIKPVFDILGTVPGYREYDISMWFLMFFILFFAMIVGDAAYGVIFLGAAVYMHRKSKRVNNAIVLLYVLSSASIVWGALTGTWFGSKAILEAVPFLQAMVIPRFSNYPELFGLTATTAQNTVMQFCFIVGTLHLSLACAMNIYRKSSNKDLSVVSDVGWLLMIDSLYFLVLMLVINEPVDASVVATIVGIGFVLVVMFGSQGPGIPFLKGLAGGAAGLFTTFLNSISAFSNIISYIRLFAVGMASLAIAQSFNSMASGLMQGLAIPAGILILVFGHGLNLVMALLSVVVHGVRLNLLEFSGQLGMEWTGFAYEPFRETVESSSQTL